MMTLVRLSVLLGAVVVAAASSSSNPPPPESPGGPASTAGPPPPQAMDVQMATGLWKTSFGPVKIEVDAARGADFLMGVWVYDRAGEEVIGSFSGQITGNVLTFVWEEPAMPAPLRGTGHLVFDVSGRSFYGKWWTTARDRGGDWTGARATAVVRGGVSPAPAPEARPYPDDSGEGDEGTADDDSTDWPDPTPAP